MDRINGANWIDIGGGRHGFRAQNKVAGIAGTVLAPEWLNAIQEEMAYVIETAGLALNAADTTQLYQALRLFVRAGMYALDTGAVNAIEVTAVGVVAEGSLLLVKIGNTNTIAGVTLKVNAGGTDPVYFADGTALTIGALQGGSYALFAYSGASWRLVNHMPWATAVDAADRTIERRAIDPKRLHGAITDLLGYDNLIINPLFRINQNAFAGGAVATGVYAIDQWGAIGAANFTFVNNVATVAAGRLKQIVEDPGTALGTMTLHWDGSCLGSVNGAAWAASPITFNHAGGAIVIEFNAAGTVSKPMLAVGAKPIPFRAPPLAVDRLNCFRYYYKNTDQLDHYTYTNYGSAVANGLRYYLSFPTQMRVVPAVSVTAYNLIDRCSGTPSPRADLSGFTMRVDVGTGAGIAGIANVRFTADARISL